MEETMNNLELQKRANDVRIGIVRAVHSAKAGHPGGSLSAADVFTYLYFEEMNIDPVIAALNGGEDYELLFTVPLELREKIISLGCIDIIGHITKEETGAYLVTPDGSNIALKAQGFTPKQ